MRQVVYKVKSIEDTKERNGQDKAREALITSLECQGPLFTQHCGQEQSEVYATVSMAAFSKKMLGAVSWGPCLTVRSHHCQISILLQVIDMCCVALGLVGEQMQFLWHRKLDLAPAKGFPGTDDFLHLRRPCCCTGRCCWTSLSSPCKFRPGARVTQYIHIHVHMQGQVASGPVKSTRLFS